jgi:hypothetical protein
MKGLTFDSKKKIGGYFELVFTVSKNKNVCIFLTYVLYKRQTLLKIITIKI